MYARIHEIPMYGVSRVGNYENTRYPRNYCKPRHKNTCTHQSN